MRFSNKVVIVSGGSSGIGKEIASRIVSEGGTVYVISRNSPEKAAAVCREISIDKVGDAIPVCVDVGDATAVAALIESVIEQSGRIDIAVNAAGIFLPSPVGETKEDLAEVMLRTNVIGAWNVVQSVSKHMKHRGSGKILNFSSVAGLAPFKGFALYSGSKAAVSAMTRVMASELAPFGINVNAIAPGNTATPMNSEIRNDASQKEVFEAMKNMTPSKTVFSDPADIAACACFLVSDEAIAIHGATLLADEGISAALG